MIDEDRTKQLYGYTSDELPPQSNKPIVRVCEECGGYKTVKKQNYRVFCIGCAHGTDEARKINSGVHIGYKHTDEARAKVSLSLIGNKRNLGVAHTYEARRKMSANRQGIDIREWNGFVQENWREWMESVYLNEWFPGCERHHLTETVVIRIPKELHRHLPHCLKTGYNMGEMNMLAIQYVVGWW